jgi:hypothetical protein
MSELPATAFRLDPELVSKFVAGQVDDAGQADLADEVARLLPFHRELPHPIGAALAAVTSSVGGDEPLLRWLDRFPGRPRITARLYRVMALLDQYAANAGVLRALEELRAHEPFPYGLAAHLVRDTTSHTLASLSQQIELLLGDDRPADAVCLSRRALALLTDIAPRAAELDVRAADLGPAADVLSGGLGQLVRCADDNHADHGVRVGAEPGSNR